MLAPEQSDLNDLWKFYEGAFASNVERYASRKIRLRLPFVPLKVLERICSLALDRLTKQPGVLKLSGEFVVVGNIQGSLLDLFRVLHHHGSPATTKYLFLGNYICGGGEFSIQVLTVLFLMKAMWPDNVQLLRGCQEFSSSCEAGGFKDEVSLLYGEDNAVYNLMIQTFSWLPYAAVLNERVFCVSGGIGRDALEFDRVLEIQRPFDGFASKVIVDLMWSEPTDLLPMFLPSSRTYGSLFGIQAVDHFMRKTNFVRIVRSNQPIESGCASMFKGQVVTVFTASKFDKLNNGSGVFICRKEQEEGALEEDGEDFVRYPPLGRLRKTDATFITSASDERFVIEEVETLTTQYRNMSLGALPVAGGLKLSCALFGKAKDPTMFLKTRPKRTSLSRTHTKLVVPKVQRLTLDL